MAKALTNITLEQVQKASKDRPARYVVKVDNRPVGLLEKYRNTKTDTHPWKAFTGIGFAATFSGSFYEADGGKDAAISKVVYG